jgi:hypothetical protein
MTPKCHVSRDDRSEAIRTTALRVIVIQNCGSFMRSEAPASIHCGRVNAMVPLPPDGRPVCLYTSQAPEAREGTSPEQLALASLVCVFLTISLGSGSSSYERPHW